MLVGCVLQARVSSDHQGCLEEVWLFVPLTLVKRYVKLDGLVSGCREYYVLKMSISGVKAGNLQWTFMTLEGVGGKHWLCPSMDQW